MEMNRIVVIGSIAAGKSTFARDLGRILHINVVHLDRIFWEPGWREKPRETRISLLEEIIRRKEKEQWIIEGTHLGSSEPRLQAADTIIFLDIALLICLSRIFKRYFNRGSIRRGVPNGCQNKFSALRIFKVLIFPIRGRITLNKKLKKYTSKQIIRLRSQEEVENFLAQLETQANSKSKIA